VQSPERWLGTYTDYSFNGKAYVVTSARTVEGEAADRLFETPAPRANLPATPVIAHVGT
jgi:hypothetical protein